MSGSGAEAGAFSVGVSLVAFSSAAEVRGFIAEAGRRHGLEPAFELSYAMSAALLAEVVFLEGHVLSAHAPCPAAELFPNLGSRDPRVVGDSLEAVRASAATAAAFGAGALVLHPGYTTDAAVLSDAQRRLASLEAHADTGDAGWLWLQRGTVCRPGYCESPGYRLHLEVASENLERAAAVCAEEGVRLAVENLNPRLTYLFQLPSELARLAARIPGIALCVDLGHLWLSSLVHGFGFVEGLAEILATGRVVTTHVHDNGSTLGPPPMLSDDHAPIGTGSVPIGDALPLLAAAGVRPLIVESLGPAMASFEALVRLARGALRRRPL
jgi:sugar phosphate isomerase/epimerase